MGQPPRTPQRVSRPGLQVPYHHCDQRHSQETASRGERPLRILLGNSENVSLGRAEGRFPISLKSGRMKNVKAETSQIKEGKDEKRRLKSITPGAATVKRIHYLYKYITLVSNKGRRT